MKRVRVLVLVAVTWFPTAVCLRAQVQPEHAVSRQYNRSLGVDCDHCHSRDDFTSAAKPAFDFAARMQRMLQGLNDGPLRGIGGITCWTCHRGQTIPARLPRANWESIAAAHSADFAGRDGLGLTMSVYAASLGVDCSHCHVAGDWTAASKPAHQMVTTMSAIFELIPTYFENSTRMPRTQCYMCHQGRTRVDRAP